MAAERGGGCKESGGAVDGEGGLGFLFTLHGTGDCSEVEDDIGAGGGQASLAGGSVGEVEGDCDCGLA